MRTRIRSVLVRASLILWGAATGLLLAEVALALVAPLANERTTAGLNIYETDVQLGYRLRSNVLRRFRWIDRQITIATDEAGRRVPERRSSPPSSPPSERPILAVAGDSFVFGNEVQAEETFTELLAAPLGADAVNLGVGGYALVQSARALERFLRLETADRVAYALLVVFVGNDIEGGARPYAATVDLNGYLVTPGSSAPPLVADVRRWLSLNSRVTFLTQRAFRALRASGRRESRQASEQAPDGPPVTPRDGSPPVPPRDASPPPTRAQRWIYDEERFDPGRLDGHRTVLESVRDVARSVGVPLTVVILPEREQISGTLGDLPDRRLLHLLGELGIPAVDLLPVMRAQTAGSGPLFHAVAMGHLSPRGHRVVAGALAEALAQSAATGAESAGAFPELRPEEARSRGTPVQGGEP